MNQRDCNYLPAAYQEFSYRKAFTDALDSTTWRFLSKWSSMVFTPIGKVYLDCFSGKGSRIQANSKPWQKR
jgi:hypothetical protein